MVSRGSLVSIVLVVLALGADSFAAAPYRDAARHFALELPDGWVVMTPEELNAINALAGQIKAQSPIRYEAGFRRADTPPGSFPYILVQMQPAKLQGASYEAIEKEFARDLNAPIKAVQSQIADVIKDVSIGSVVLDRTRNRIILRMKMEAIGVGPVQYATVGHLGAEGLVYVHSYAADNEFSQWLPTFNQLNDSFHYDAGYTFTPDNRSRFARIVQGAALWGVVGGIGGGLVSLWMVFFRKKAKPELQQNADSL